ncbi:MAG: hypothetical protein LBU39_07800 [Desulfobulbaceae bacterium]|nr:hypothetical protein [Desulfobulbaceae bacterium]
MNSATMHQMADRHNEAANYTWLSDILAGGPDWHPLAEIRRIYQALAREGDVSFLDRLYDDITAMFAGKYPGFRGCVPCGYHDLRHTRNVALATVRLMHGLHCCGVHLPEDMMQLGMVCAFFHDTGMLLRDDDQAETGTAYLKEHEQRSIAFMREYLLKNDLCLEYYQSCETIINCTNLMIDPRELPFSCYDQMMVGQVVGSADIMAQMADRYYLESLPILFKEFRSAGVDRYDTTMDLLAQTTSFYHEVIDKRLHTAFDNIGEAMRDHFRVWWNIDRNLYAECIENNVRYLESCVVTCGGDESRLGLCLRRKLPIAR